MSHAPSAMNEPAVGVGSAWDAWEDWLDASTADALLEGALQDTGVHQAQLDGYNAFLRGMGGTLAELGTQYVTNDEGSMLVGVTLSNVRVRGGVHTETCGTVRTVTPQECRERGLTYIAVVLVDVRVDTYAVLPAGPEGDDGTDCVAAAAAGAAKPPPKAAALGALPRCAQRAVLATAQRVPDWMPSVCVGSAAVAGAQVPAAAAPPGERRRITRKHLANPTNGKWAWVHTSTVRHHGVVHAHIPLMVGSDACPASGAAHGVTADCVPPGALRDTAGYFVVNGRDKVVVCTDSSAFNCATVTSRGPWLASPQDTVPSKAVVSELRSTHPARNRSSCTASVRAVPCPSTPTGVVATVKGNFMVRPVPLMALMRALGVPSVEAAAAALVTRGAALDASIVAAVLRDSVDMAAFAAAEDDVPVPGDTLELLEAAARSADATAGAVIAAVEQGAPDAYAAALHALQGSESGKGTVVTTAQRSTDWCALTPVQALVQCWPPKVAPSNAGRGAALSAIAAADTQGRALRMGAYELFPQAAMSWGVGARLRKLQLLCVMGGRAVHVAHAAVRRCAQDEGSDVQSVCGTPQGVPGCPDVPPPLDDRRHMGCTQVQTAGFALHQLYRQFVADGLRKAMRRMGEDMRKGLAPRALEMAAPRSVRDALVSCVSTGNMSIKGAAAASAQQGLSQLMHAQSMLTAAGHTRCVRSTVPRQSKSKAARTLHPSAWGVLCPYDTPEGETCGLQRQLALGAVVLTGEHGGSLPAMVYDALNTHAGQGEVLCTPSLRPQHARGKDLLLGPNDMAVDGRPLSAPDAVLHAADRHAMRSTVQCGGQWTQDAVDDAAAALQHGAHAASCLKWGMPSAIMVQGCLMGYATPSASAPSTAHAAAAVVRAVRAARESGTLPACTEVAPRWAWDLVDVNAAAGRVRLPVLPLHPTGSGAQQPLLKLQRIAQQCAARNASSEALWREALLQGAVQWMGPLEMAGLHVASSVEGAVRRRDAGGEAARLPVAVLVSPTLLLGMSAAVLPLSNHNPAVRTTYGVGQLKAALAKGRDACSTESTAYTLLHPQAPLVRTRADALAQQPGAVQGHNVRVAILLATHNQEDAVVLNADAAGRGLCSSLQRKTYVEDADAAPGRSARAQAAAAQIAARGGNVLGVPHSGAGELRDANYSTLAPCGMALPGTRVGEGDVLLGRMRMPGAKSDATRPRDTSLVLPTHTPSCRVEAVLLSLTPAQTLLTCVRTVRRKVIGVGDKVATQHGQKGVVGAVLPSCDMPYTAAGPLSLLVSTHGIPGRMTVGQLLDMTLGELATAWGAPLDGTANVRALDPEAVLDACLDAGIAKVVHPDAVGAVCHPCLTAPVADCTAAQLHAAALHWKRAAPLRSIASSLRGMLPDEVVDALDASSVAPMSAPEGHLEDGQQYCKQFPRHVTVGDWVHSLPPMCRAAADREAVAAALAHAAAAAEAVPVPSSALGGAEDCNAQGAAGKVPAGPALHAALTLAAAARGVVKPCVTTVYDGVTGQPCPWPAFVGTTYVRTMRQQADDKVHSRERGRVSASTRQPTRGRRKGGGFKCGEMERDAIETSGAAGVLHDALAVRSDQTWAHVCGACGNAVPCIDTHISAAAGVTGGGATAQEPYCPTCKHGAAVRVVSTTHSSQRFVEYLAAAHVQVRFELEDAEGVDLVGAPEPGSGAPAAAYPSTQ